VSAIISNEDIEDLSQLEMNDSLFQLLFSL